MSKKKQVATMVVTTSVTQKMDVLKKQSSPLVRTIEQFTIRTVDDQEHLVSVLKKLKGFKTEAEAQQADFVDPAKQIIARSRALFKPFLDSVDAATVLGKDKILKFVNSRLIASQTVGDSFKAGKIAKLSTVVRKQAELEDNSNTRKIWVLKIINPKVIPNKYLIPNEVLIREHLKEGKKIPGCSLVQENIIAI